jgi:hypothetical protein
VGWLEPLRAALDAAPAPVTFFFRDDDAGWDDARLKAMLAVIAARELACDLAVIPRALEPASAELLADVAGAWAGRLGLHQHGLAHVNHEPEGKKGEFGPARSPEEQRADLIDGRERLAELLPGLVQPVFTPPWNRATADTAAALAELGFGVLSRDASATPFGVPGLDEVPTSVDWSYARRKGVRLTFTELGALAADRAGDGGPVGVNLHHAVMDGGELELLGELCDLLAAHPSARSESLLDVSGS